MESERFIKFTFKEEGMGIQAEKVSKADMFCAMLGLMSEIESCDFREVIRLIRQVQKAKKAEYETEEKNNKKD